MAECRVGSNDGHVIVFRRDDGPNAASRVLDVPDSSRNQVNMCSAVEDGPPSGLPARLIPALNPETQECRSRTMVRLTSRTC